MTMNDNVQHILLAKLEVENDWQAILLRLDGLKW